MARKKKKSQVRKQPLEKNSAVTHVAATEGESHYLYACIYNVDQFLARLTKKHKEKTRNNIRNKIRALL